MGETSKTIVSGCVKSRESAEACWHRELWGGEEVGVLGSLV